MEVALKFQLYPKQLLALNTPARELLFGGATRGGKSHFARVALVVWCLAIPMLQCVLIRKKYQDILDNHVYGRNGFIDLLGPLIELKQATVTQNGVTFANGSRITFKHCQDERQFESAQGITTHVLFIDEATQLSERLIGFFRAWCTMPEEMKAELPEDFRGMFPRIIYTANPIGPSVPYFKRKFVKARPVEAIEVVDGFPRQYIPARVEDNPSENEEETRGRVGGMYDASLARALLEGDWDAPIGEFFPEWSEDLHVVPDFIPPSHWYRFRSFDWGTADPFAVYWWAVSDGEPFYEAGEKFWFPRGALVAYREWYGCDEEHRDRGLRLRNEDIAYGIRARSRAFEEEDLVTLTDSLPFQDRGGVTIAHTFRECGIPLMLGDTTRIAGWSQLRSRLKGKLIDSNDKTLTPMLYFVESCRAARDYIPALPRHPSEGKSQDAAEHGESTHACDAIRLACMAHTRIKDEQPGQFDTRNLVNSITFNDALKLVQRNKAMQRGGSW